MPPARAGDSAFAAFSATRGGLTGDAAPSDEEDDSRCTVDLRCRRFICCTACEYVPGEMAGGSLLRPLRAPAPDPPGLARLPFAGERRAGAEAGGVETAGAGIFAPPPPDSRRDGAI